MIGRSAKEEWERQRPGEPMPEWFERLFNGDTSVVGGIKPGSQWKELNDRYGKEE